MTKSNCTFTRMCGCYVDADKNIITTLNETFLNLEDAEYFKYLDIAKAVLKGKIGNNLLNLSFNGAAVISRAKEQQAEKQWNAGRNLSGNHCQL